MTNRERQFAAIGFEYAEGIDSAKVVRVPTTGREIRKTSRGTWEAQPWNDNYWKEFDDLLDAAKFATEPRHQLIRSEWEGRDVYITEGVSVDSVGKVFGIFTSAEDAMSENADQVAFAIVSADRLDRMQLDTAKHNSEVIGRK